MANVYYQPEEFGLEQIAQHVFSDGSYCFDYRVIWRDTNGKYYSARDSGCSCPSPFEDYTRIEDLEDFSESGLIREAQEESKREYYAGDKIGPWISIIRAIARERREFRKVAKENK